MSNLELPIPIHEIAFLQAYLYEIFVLEGHCKKNFDQTIWHLRERHTDEEVKSLIDFFKNKDLKCDCDVIRSIDLMDISKGVVQFHKHKTSECT